MNYRILLLLIIFLAACNTDRGYKILEEDEKYILVQSWIGTDTIIHLEKRTENYRCKYLGYKTKYEPSGRYTGYTYTLYGLCEGDTITATQREPERCYKGIIGLDKLVKRIEIGDSILVTKQYYPYKVEYANYIFQ